ncbi:MAG: HAD family phosphatase [Planctomycetaceae bacterium]
MRSGGFGDAHTHTHTLSLSLFAMLKTLLCDLGNVLVFFSHERMCRQIAKVGGCESKAVEQALLKSGLQARLERGELDDNAGRMVLEEALQTTLPEAEFRVAMGDIFTLNLDMPAMLDCLKSQGIRLVLLSNTCATHYEWISDQFFPLLWSFDAEVLSYAVKAAKPDDAIFEHALQQIDCLPEECLYIDDIPEYVAAGMRHGLMGHCFTDLGPLLPRLDQLGVNLNA